MRPRKERGQCPHLPFLHPQGMISPSHKVSSILLKMATELPGPICSAQALQWPDPDGYTRVCALTACLPQTLALLCQVALPALSNSVNQANSFRVPSGGACRHSVSAADATVPRWLAAGHLIPHCSTGASALWPSLRFAYFYFYLCMSVCMHTRRCQSGPLKGNV